MYIFYISIATVPAVIVGLLLKDKIEYTFESPFTAAVGFLFTGLLLVGGGFLKRKKEIKLNLLVAIGVGTAQAFAILPGISRSGITIMTGIIMGLSFKDSFEFSFLLSIPVILGGVILDTLNNGFLCDPGAMKGAAFALLFAFLSLYLFKNILKKNKLYIFGIYCLLISITVLAILIF